MPQIWVSDIELAEILGCSPHEARQQAIEAGLARRRCSDGASRSKVPPGLLQAVVAQFFGAADHLRQTGRSEDFHGVTAPVVPAPPEPHRHLPLAA